MLDLKASYTHDDLNKLLLIRIEEFKDNLSEPKHLFNMDGSFNLDNWNSGQDVLRYLLCKYDCDCYTSETFTYESNGENNENDYTEMIIQSSIQNDDHYFTIFFTMNGEIIPGQIYNINWYKSRGRTAGIFQNGQLITEDHYLALYENVFKYLSSTDE